MNRENSMTDISQFTHQPHKDAMSIRAKGRTHNQFGLNAGTQQAATSTAPKGNAGAREAKVRLSAGEAYATLNQRQGPPIA
jgi:hypothetical protein